MFHDTPPVIGLVVVIPIMNLLGGVSIGLLDDYQVVLIKWLQRSTATYCANVLPGEDYFHSQIPPWDDDYSDPDYPFEAYI